MLWYELNTCKIVRVSQHCVLTGAMDGQDFEIMLAHYSAFLSMTIHCIFFSMASVFARWDERNCSGNHGQKLNFRLLLTSYLNLQHPFIVWGLSKYQFHLAFNLLFITANQSSVQIIYFYRLVWPGTYYNSK